MHQDTPVDLVAIARRNAAAVVELDVVSQPAIPARVGHGAGMGGVDRLAARRGDVLPAVQLPALVERVEAHAEPAAEPAVRGIRPPGGADDPGGAGAPLGYLERGVPREGLSRRLGERVELGRQVGEGRLRRLQRFGRRCLGRLRRGERGLRGVFELREDRLGGIRLIGQRLCALLQPERLRRRPASNGR